ncbi:MAG: 3-beta hydroxysteroid dehydrogenase, partial [Shewanella sp.]
MTDNPAVFQADATQTCPDNLAQADFDPREQATLHALAAKVSHAFVTGAGGFLGKAI